MDSSKVNATKPSPEKKAYQHPRLQNYGNISQLTQAGTGSMGDMGGGMMSDNMT